MDILTILIILIHEHGIAFHLFVSFLPSSISLNVLQFSVYRSFTSLVKFIPRYFILFDAVINEIVFLICLSDSSLLVYRNATEFWILNLYLASLLNLFILAVYLVEFLCFFF